MKSLANRNTKLLIELNEKMKKSFTLQQPMKANFEIKFESIKDDNGVFKFYTGLPSPDIFLWYLLLFKSKLSKKCSRLSFEDHLLLILMKLRLGLLNKDLAHRFNIQPQTVTRIYRSWLPIIAQNVKFLIVWPERHVVRRNLPSSFRKKFLNCVVIIDCTEIYIERSFSLEARAQTWSNYKNTNTFELSAS